MGVCGFQAGLILLVQLLDFRFYVTIKIVHIFLRSQLEHFHQSGNLRFIRSSLGDIRFRGAQRFLVLQGILHGFHHIIPGTPPDKSPKRLAGSVRKHNGRESPHAVLLGKLFIGGFHFLGLFLAARIIQLHQHEIFLRFLLEVRLAEYVGAELHAGRAPVGTGELNH